MIAEGTAGKRRLVILGGGFGGYRLALGLSERYFETTIVSPKNHFLFTPLLASTTVGTLEFRSIIEPIRGVRDGTTFLQAGADSIDFDRRVITCTSEFGPGARFELAFDDVVIAVGATTNTFGVPGVEDHGYFLKELSHARALRNAIVKSIEHAALPGIPDDLRRRLLHFVVVGGGPTGVEFAGELFDYMRRDVKHLAPDVVRDVRITLIEGSRSLLSSFDSDLSAYTRKTFAARGIEVRTETVVRAVRAHELELSDGSRVPFGVLVWAAGVAQTPLVQGLSFAKDRFGRLLTDPFLRLPGHENVYALGDCAVVEGTKYPMTGQLAQQSGAYLARALNRKARGRTVKPFRYLHLGMFAYIGGKRALGDTPGVRWKGWIAWIMWRSIYLTKLVSIRNKVRVLFDWVRGWIFGRDTASFD